MNRLHTLLFAFFFLLMFICSSPANDKPQNAPDKTADVTRERDLLQLETIVVESKAASEDKQHIESRSLQSHKVVDLSEILSDELVEIQMIRKSGYGNEVSMRGFGQENIKVMLDGGLLEGACGSRKDPSLSHINMLTVKNIVIRQGPFDVTRPGCLGGYLDAVTKKPESGFSGEVLGKAGSFGFYSGGLITRGGSDKIQGLIGYNFSRSGQYRDGSGNRLWKVREGMGASYNADGRDSTAFRKHDVWAKLKFMPSKQHTILLEHTYGKAGDILTPRVAFDTEKEITNLSRASWEMRDACDWSKKLTASFYRNEVDHYPFQDFRAVGVPKNNKVESVITGGSVENVTETGFASFTYGIDIYHRGWKGDVFNSRTGAALNDKLIPSVNTLNIGSFIQMDKAFDTWSLGMGLRLDRFSQKAEESLVHTRRITDENRQVDYLAGGHVSAEYFINPHAMLFGGIGRSYRTPTSTERYIQGNPGFFGNPELKPVGNTEPDLGFRYERSRWMMQIKGFYSFLDNFIYQENNPAGYRSYTNIDARIYGADVKARMDLSYGFSLNGGIAWQRGQKVSHPENNSDDDLGQIAPVKTQLALNYSNKNPFSLEDTSLFGTLEWIHSEKARAVDRDAGEQRLPSWDVINLRLGYRFRFCTLYLGADNLFDRKYTVANSYEWDVVGGAGANPAVVSEPGRFLYASLGLTW